MGRLNHTSFANKIYWSLLMAIVHDAPLDIAICDHHLGTTGRNPGRTPQHENFYPYNRRTGIYHIAFANLFWGAKYQHMVVTFKTFYLLFPLQLMSTSLAPPILKPSRPGKTLQQAP